jgi:hypothetical protein
MANFGAERFLVDPGSTRPERHFPSGAAQTRIVSAARIRLDSRKSVRPFKGILCDDVCEFESHMPSHAVGSLWGDGDPIAAVRLVGDAVLALSSMGASSDAKLSTPRKDRLAPMPRNIARLQHYCSRRRSACRMAIHEGCANCGLMRRSKT